MLWEPVYCHYGLNLVNKVAASQREIFYEGLFSIK